MEDTFVVHVKDSEGDLGWPIYDLLFLEFFASLIFLLFLNHLIEISSVAKFHDDVEFLPLDDALAVTDDVYVFEFF